MAKEVKVKVIVTSFVETDATQFKSVVQRLTGKDSVVAEVGKERPPRAEEVDGGGGGGGGGKGGEWAGELMKGNWMVEIPPSLDELYDLLMR